MSEVMIQCEHLASGYNGLPIMTDINLSVNKGEIVFILGGSGCGKSTLLKHMIGQVPPISGTVRIKGEDYTSAQGADYERILRTFGVMYQSGALFGNMTVLGNVLLPLEEFTTLPRDVREVAARMKLAQVALVDRCEMMPSDLSGGMKKRAAIARAMALDPEILFLDEPSAGLDPVTSAQLDKLICSLSRGLGMTIVIISHELASIEAIADRAIYLDRAANGVLDQGTPAYLREESPHAAIRAFFNRQAE
ncbi:MAG: ATP-binding cassette domain-containing protein [Kiritimatiellia bacterium]